MGYHVQIRRVDASGHSTIDREEWIRFVESSRHFSFVEPGSDSAAEQFARRIHAAYWHGDKNQSLGWSDNQIWTSSPSPEFIEEMVRIAPRFEGAVFGDEGERITAEDLQESEQGHSATKSRGRWEIDDWRIRVGLGLLLGVVLILLRVLLARR